MKDNLNIILIVSDTFRRDNLSCYGNNDIHTPRLNDLAKHSTIFDKCYACSFPTMPARSDIFTGKWTFTYMGWEPISAQETFLPELLKSAGYTCASVVDTPFLSRLGYNRGFNHFETLPGQTTKVPVPSEHDLIKRRDEQRPHETNHAAPSTMLAAERWLEHNRKNKFFLYVDTWDPHEPWDAPKYYVERYYPRYDGRIVKPCYGYWKKRGVTEEDFKIAYASYCGEVSMVDRWIGFLLDGLEAMNLTENTAVIFTTDHGFYFGEHGILGKGINNISSDAKSNNQNSEKPKVISADHEHLMIARSGVHASPLYEDVAHLPLIIQLPGVEPQNIKSLVSLLDLMPTILDLASVEIPNTIHGKSVIPLLEGEQQDNWDIVMTARPLTFLLKPITIIGEQEKRIQASLTSTITSKDWSLIYSIEGEPAELYHLPSDPEQEHNVINERKDVAADLLRKLVPTLTGTGTHPELVKLRCRL